VANRVMQNVRQESNAGWYVGGLEMLEDNAICWDKESCYYPSEAVLQNDYPTSISMEEACKQAKQRRWINWDYNVLEQGVVSETKLVNNETF
jgi:hypothetical protein